MDERSRNRSIRLAPRLAAALSMLPRADTLFDIGCDHGKLCLAALCEGKFRRAVAVDVSEASLAKAAANFARFGFTAEFVCADGLAAFDPAGYGDYAVAMLGMGGELIAAILARGAAAARGAGALMLQPMGGERELRDCLFENGYAVLDETTVADAGRYYQLILARYCPEEAVPYADDALLEFGARNYARRQDALKRLLEKVYASRARRMERAKRNGVIPETLERELSGVQRLLEHWEDDS